MFNSPFKTPGSSKLIVRIDPSSLKNLDCPTRFLYSNLLGYTTLKPQPATEFGQAVHQAVASLRRGMNKLDAFDVALDYVCNSKADFTNDYRNTDLLVDVLQEYLDFRNPERDPFQPMLLGGKPGVELSYEIPYLAFEHVDFTLAGVVDEIGTYQGMTRFLDIKTTGLYPNKFSHKWRTSHQMLFYSHVLKQTGVSDTYLSPIIDAIFLRGTKGKRLLRIDDNIILPEHVEEYMDDVKRQCNLLNVYIEDNYFTRNRSCCETIFGDCQFRQVCDSYVKLRGTQLAAFFRQREYNPAKFGINE